VPSQGWHINFALLNLLTLTSLALGATFGDAGEPASPPVLPSRFAASPLNILTLLCSFLAILLESFSLCFMCSFHFLLDSVDRETGLTSSSLVAAVVPFPPWSSPPRILGVGSMEPVATNVMVHGLASSKATFLPAALGLRLAPSENLI
jgi:hypothetical protein